MADLIRTLQFLIRQEQSENKNQGRIEQYIYPFILDFLYNHSVYRKLNLTGDACLHYIYGLPQFPEKLVLNNNSGIALDDFTDEIRSYFNYEAGFPEFEIGEQIGNQWTIRKYLSFPLSSDSNSSETSVRIEIWNHPERASIAYTPLFLGGFSFVPAHFTIETIMAGYLLECLETPVFEETSAESEAVWLLWDLLWMMKKGIQPDEQKLVSEGKRPYTVQTAMLLLMDRVNAIDFNMDSIGKLSKEADAEPEASLRELVSEAVRVYFE